MMASSISVTNLIFHKNSISKPRRRNSRVSSRCGFKTHYHNLQLFSTRKDDFLVVLCRLSGETDSGAQPSSILSDVNSSFSSLSSTSETYVPVMVRMLGLDNDPRDREQAVIALWKYSLGGKNYVDNIIKFRGCVNLVVNLLTSLSTRSCEAAAGLLRMISTVNSYRDIVAESGAIEETTALLRRASLTSEVKEQSLCMLWNLSADDKVGLKIANPSLLPLLVKCLDDNNIKTAEAAAGVLANLALNTSNHTILVEFQVIPKLAKFLTCETEASKIIKKEARNALLELAKDNYYKILVMEEGLVLVPLVGASAYASFKPAFHLWPSFPDGTELRRSTRSSSGYGASELLIGLNLEENSDNIDKLKMDAIVGRAQQQFLARVGAIEKGEEGKSDAKFSTSSHHTLLPWRDGIARLALILELEDEVAITRAADAISAASINETICISFKEAGAVQRLVYLLRHNSSAVKSAVANALENLSVSIRLCETMEREGVTQILIDVLKDSETSGTLMEKSVSTLARIFDPNKQMKFKFNYGPVNASRKSSDLESENGDGKMVDTLSGETDSGAQPSSILSDVNSSFSSLSSTSETYVPVMVRMLGLDNDPRDREQAVIALWKYSLGGKNYVDNIIKFRGCVNLVVNLLTSLSTRSCEAAAGLLRMISTVNSYRDIVAESGAIEETTALLRRASLTSEVKEQSLCMLWNLSADDKVGLKIANPSLLPLLVKCLDDNNIKTAEAAAGVLANLALNTSNHTILVEFQVIPKLAKFLTCETEASKIIKKEARNALLELAKDNYYKILVMEEGLVLVPLVGASAYASFKPAFHLWPSFPDGTELRRSTRSSSGYGASELLIGLNLEENSDNIDKLKMDAIVGRAQQQFLARVGAIEKGEEGKSNAKFSTSSHHTLLPWRDGIARLALILELEDEVAITRAADAISAASINETIRISFKEAGAVQRLVYLLRHNSSAVKSAVANALENLSVSIRRCETMEREGVTQILIDVLKDSETSGTLMEKSVSTLARIFDPNKQMKFKFNYGPVNASRKSSDLESENGASLSNGKMVDTNYVLDSALVARLATVLETGSSSLQSQVASVLEYIAMVEPTMDAVFARHMESGLLAVFQQNFPEDMDADERQEPNPAFLEEAGLAISAASKLLTKLVDYPKFRDTISFSKFTNLLRKILKSDIPLHHKDWVAACLVRLSSFSIPFKNSITTEITLYETIPRLIEQIKTSQADGQEAAVVQLNRVVSEGIEGATQAIVAHGGVFPVVKLIEEGSHRTVEAGLAILYNLSMDSDNHAAILAAGAVPVLTRMVRSQASYSMRALRLLRCLHV